MMRAMKTPTYHSPRLPWLRPIIIVIYTYIVNLGYKTWPCQRKTHHTPPRIKQICSEVDRFTRPARQLLDVPLRKWELLRPLPIIAMTCRVHPICDTTQYYVRQIEARVYDNRTMINYQVLM
jgi:hypothetical protein